MDSTVGSGIQCLGILLVTHLSFFMMRSVKTVSGKYWTIAWGCLFVSLTSLFAGFQLRGELQRLLYSFYFLGEYAFGLMLIAGCRNHSRGITLSRKNLPAIVPFAVMAGVLPYASADFNNLFIVHSAVLS